MKKVSLDGLLALKPEEIKLVYLRCLGNTMEYSAKKSGFSPATAYKKLKEDVYPMLGVEGWGDIKADLCKPLRKMVSSVEELENWPEGFREKIEALRESPAQPVESQTDKKPTIDSKQPQPIPSEQQGSGIDRGRRPPWILIAVSLLVLCVLCIFGMFTIWQTFNPFQFFQTTPTSPAPTEIPTLQLTNTQPVVFTHTSSPTLTDTPIPPTPTVTITPTETPTITNTPLPTETPTPAVEPLFFDDFTDGKSDMWQTIYGEPIIVDNALTFQANTLMVIDASDWTDYEVSFDVSNIQCQGGVSSRGVTIGQRYQNANNMMALRIFHWGDYCDAQWYLIKDGDWDKLPNASFPVPPKDSNGVRHFILSVEGNTYNSPFGVPLVIEDFQTGGVALLANKGVIIDNFKVIPLDTQN